MPQYLHPVNLDDEFRRARVKIVVNDLPARTEEHRQLFSKLSSDTYESDLFSIIPKCGCPGDTGLRGEHLVGEYCEKCGHFVQSMLDDEIYSTLWFRRPKGVERLINPLTWIMLNDRFTHSSFSAIRWLVDRGYNPQTRRSKVIETVMNAGIPRGYNNFVQNFDKILDFLFSIKDFANRASKYHRFLELCNITDESRDPLRQYLHDFRGYIFSDHIPVPSKMLMVVERSAYGTHVDATLSSARDAANTMFSLERDFHDQTPRTMENRTAKIICLLADFYSSAYSKHLRPKEGHLRKQAYGSRTNFSFRAVLTSHDSITNYDEIHIPWGVGVTCLNLHLMNKLMSPTHKHGNMSVNNAQGFLMEHIYRYHPVIDELFQEIIFETGKQSLGILVHRNPTLSKGSCQLLQCPKVKTNPNDRTVSTNDLVSTSYNAKNWPTC